MKQLASSWPAVCQHFASTLPAFCLHFSSSGPAAGQLRANFWPAVFHHLPLIKAYILPALGLVVARTFL